MNPLRRISEQLRQMRWAQVLIELLLLVRDLERVDEILKEFIGFKELQTKDGIDAYRALRATVAPADSEAVAAKLSRLTPRRALRLVRAT